MNKRNARELTGMYYVDGIPVGSIKDLLATGVKPASPHGNTGWLKRVLMSYPNGSRGWTHIFIDVRDERGRLILSCPPWQHQTHLLNALREGRARIVGVPGWSRLEPPVYG